MAGAGVGTLVGLGVLAGVVPVIGPAIAAGTLGTILLNAAGGAAALGIAGALIGWGIPEEDAKYYEGEVKAGRFLVTVDAGDRKDEAWAVLHKHGGYNRAVGATGTKNGKPTARASADGVTTADGTGKTLQLKEEQLKATKRRVKAGEVEVRKEVVTEQKTVTVPVEREEIVIERRPARGRAAGDLKAETIRVPVSEERVSVEKETVVTGEVGIGKRKVAGTRTVAGTVRKEELRVEETGNVEVKGAAATRRRK